MAAQHDSDTPLHGKEDSVLLQSEDWKLWLQPQFGMQTSACQVRGPSVWHDLMPDCRPAGQNKVASQGRSELASANFHMLPYSNRIRDGRFDFAGESVVLADAERHSIHGALRKRAWRVVERSESSLGCEYDVRRDGAVNWPWLISAQVRYELSGRILHSVMTLTNEDERPMPAGMGWHPYFCRTLGGASPVLTIPVAGVYPDESGDCLPDGPAEPLPEALDFRTARALDPDQRIDCCLSGYTGTATLAWPDAGVSVAMSASANCTHLVLFNPDAPHFAVEPVTNANDAFNLSTQGIEAGTQVLAAGDTLSAHMTLQLSTSN